MSRTDRKAKLIMSTIFILLTIASAFSLINYGVGTISLILISFTLLVFLFVVMTPKQLQDFFDTLLD